MQPEHAEEKIFDKLMQTRPTHTCKSALQTRRRSCALKSGCHGSGRPDAGPTASQWLPASNGASLTGWSALQQRVLERRVLPDGPRQHRCGCAAGLQFEHRNGFAQSACHASTQEHNGSLNRGVCTLDSRQWTLWCRALHPRCFCHQQPRRASRLKPKPCSPPSACFQQSAS